MTKRNQSKIRSLELEIFNLVFTLYDSENISINTIGINQKINSLESELMACGWKKTNGHNRMIERIKSIARQPSGSGGSVEDLSETKVMLSYLFRE